jgi:V/A-type H+-transporting ATPase subunit F
MLKAVAVGEKHLILGFKGVGMDVVAASDAETFHGEVMKLSRNPEVGLVLVTESMAQLSPQTLADYRAVSSGILVVIPTHEGSKGFSYELMRKAVERAIGVDILGKSSD